MSQLDVVISRWLAQAKRFRECAAEQGDEGEEAVLCTVEAQRLELCAQELSDLRAD